MKSKSIQSEEAKWRLSDGGSWKNYREMPLKKQKQSNAKSSIMMGSDGISIPRLGVKLYSIEKGTTAKRGKINCDSRQ